MTVEQAIMILDPENPFDGDKIIEMIPEVKDADGIETMDIVFEKMKEACRVACKIMKEFLERSDANAD